MTLLLLPLLMGSYPLKISRVIDGDTLHGDIELPWGVTLRSQRIRCLGYDAWESSKRRQSVVVTDAEVAKGKQVTADLKQLAKTARFEIEPSGRERDNYGRILGVVTVVIKGQKIPLSEWMRERGHLRVTAPESPDTAQIGLPCPSRSAASMRLGGAVLCHP